MALLQCTRQRLVAPAKVVSVLPAATVKTAHYGWSLGALGTRDCCWVNHLAPANCVAGSYRRACVSATVAYCLVFNELECMHFYRRAACSTVAVSKRDYVATNNLMLTNNAAIIEKIPFALCRRKEYDYTS